MKKATMAAVGAWILAAASVVWLGSVMQEPTAKAAPAPKPVAAQEAPAPEHAPPAPPALSEVPMEIPETVVVAARPRAAKRTETRTGGCWTHTLVQGGSPKAPTVLACD